MKTRDAVIKRSLGRVFLHHVFSTYSVEINESTLALLNQTLKDHENAPETAKDLIRRLENKGLIEDKPFQPIPEKSISNLVSVEIEPIGICNLACKHCFVSFTGNTLCSGY